MSETDFEAQLKAIAKGMDYPLTPDIAGSVSARLHVSNRPRLISRTIGWSLTIVLILLSSLMLIPPARAAILEFIQVGVVRIFRSESNPAPEQVPATMPPGTATLDPTPQPLIPILRNFAGEMTLEEAQKGATYPILLPTYPTDLGQPAYVFGQDADGPVTILVWLDPQDPDQVLLSLHFLPSGSWAIKKTDPVVVQETSVNGHYAVWTTGPYPMQLNNGDIQFTRMINGHVLIWQDGIITYRLETGLPLEEAIQIAESLEAIP